MSIWNHPDNLKFLSFSGRPFQESQVRSWFSNHISSGVRYFIVNETSQDSILGIMIIDSDPIRGINLSSIGILPTYKGKGIGNLFIDKCIELAKTDQYKSITTEVFANNFRMIKLIIGFEFIPTGMDYHKGSDGSDYLYFKKYL